jgi:hypothetical protein
MSVTFGRPFCLLKLKAHHNKDIYAQTLREQLLKTVELN